MEREMMDLLQRGVSALERLAEDPEIKVPAFPAVCPHCEKMNPRVRIDESSNEGNLAEFVVRAFCLHCNQIFYALPFQWMLAKNIDEARAMNDERMAHGGYNN